MAMLHMVLVMSVLGGALGSAEEQLISPLHPNCTQSLTEFLLLRQETQLTKMAAAEEKATQLLQEVANVLGQVRDSLKEINSKTEGMTQGNASHPVECSPPFAQVTGKCLLLALGELHNWASARLYCREHGADLAHFHDANTYAAILKYVNTINFQRKNVCIWIGGSDEDVEDSWVWVTGELMPRGPPFWGTTDGFHLQPGEGRIQNCAILWDLDYYYIHDATCDKKCAPLCQI